ncbi:hypothetical protein BGW39_001765 [Mortierella sp. 14UC]|nr:hypothetical protein BGW39_001765 [Mortierella sp. 14UC]
MKTGLSMLKPTQPTAGGAKGLAKPSPIARSTSASALPPSTLHAATAGGSTTAVTGYSTSGLTGGNGLGTDTGYSSPYFAGSAATSPFLTAVDPHHHHSSGPAQLRSTTHSPALFSKFYDSEHRLPWLSLPGAVGSPASGANSGGSGGSGGGVEGPTSMFGRRRSDVELSSSGGSTLSGLDLSSSSQQEASFPQPPQPQPQAHSSSHHLHHPQHLLGPQELAASSRHNSPMPLSEALPHYLRKKSNESSHSMERSFSSPGTNSFHPPSHHTGPPFMLPLGSGSSSSSGGVSIHSGAAGGSVGQAPAASSSHLLFAFPGSATSHPTSTTAITSTSRPEMERASSTGVLPMMNRPSPHTLPQQQHAQTTGNSGSGSTSTGQGPASFFRTLTPGVHHHHHHHHGPSSVGLGSITGLDAVAAAAAVASSHSGTSSPSKFGTGGSSAIFGHNVNVSDRDLPSNNKEVHA